MPVAFVTGGTGSLGREITRQLLKLGWDVHTCSRDELRLKEYHKEFPDAKITLADIRDASKMTSLLKGAEAVIHLAALKHVDVLEFCPEEAIATNVLGTQNIIDAVFANEITAMLFSSTDKAVMPVNAYGCSKALAEKLCLMSNHASKHSSFKVFRWGNVIGSRGSVVHTFKQSLLQRGEVDITHLAMTRFWISLKDVASFMLQESSKEPLKVGIPPLKAASVIRLADAVAKYLGIENYKINEVGIRPGEKLHEVLTIDGPSSLEYEQYTNYELLALVQGALK